VKNLHFKLSRKKDFGRLGVLLGLFLKVNTKFYYMNEPLTMVPVARNGNFQATVLDVVL